MRSNFLVAAAATAVLTLLAGCGSSGAVDNSAAEVERAHVTLAVAFSTCDETAFTGAYADDFSFVTSNTRSPISTRDGLRAYLAASCRLQPNPTAAIASQEVRLLGDAALVSGQYLFRIPAGAKIVEVPQNFTVVYVRRAGAWQIAAQHVSLAP